MQRIFLVSGLATFLLLPLSAPGQEAKQKTYPPDAATMEAIQQKLAELRAATEQWKGLPGFGGLPTSQRQLNYWAAPMVDVFLKAAESIVRNNEFLQKDSGKQTIAVLDEGLRRAKDLLSFKQSLQSVAGLTLACGYRSNVDNSSQPFVVSFPVDYAKDPDRKWRLDIVLHGRDGTLTEVKMLAAALKRAPVKPDQDYIKLEVFGRGNNAYRWAGETDVLEALDALQKLTAQMNLHTASSRIDRNRIVLRGFSMGGAGAWHIGLHSPTKWCVIGPGAGFTATHGYIKNLPAKLPAHQEACLRIYDAVDYAENAAMVPVVAYAGDKDAQQQAAINIENILKPLGIPMTRLVGTGLAHQFPPAWQKKAQEVYVPFVQRGRNVNSKKIHFVTYTLSYPQCDWIELLALDQHYERTTVDAKVTDVGFDVRTSNVREFSLALQPALRALAKLNVTINGQVVDLMRKTGAGEADSAFVQLFRTNGVWRQTQEPLSGIKDTDIHGPIDDAFRSAFVCIRGTGQCASPQVQAYTDAALSRFQREWKLYFRGELPVVTDKEYLAELAKFDALGFHQEATGPHLVRTIVLFGDPSSNAVLAHVLGKEKFNLPIQWDRKQFKFGGQTYAADSHVPVFIYPNSPFGTGYIVVNSGHTFHAADFQGTNALLYPRLGDFAILKPTPTAKDPAAAEVIRAGLFDDDWKVPAEK
jgi:predicted esterase